MSDEGAATATELAIARDRIRERDRRSRLLHEAEAMRSEAERERTSATSAVTRLAAEVDELEGISASRVWAAVRGTRDDDLAELHRKQAVAADAVVVAEDAVARTTAAVHAAHASRQGLDDAEDRLAAAVQAREAWLLDSGTPEGAELAMVVGRLDAARVALGGLGDLLDEAQAARSLLRQAHSQLDSAADRADRDVWSDSSWHDRRKYEHLEEADHLLRRANRAIASLRAKLEDDALPGVGGIETEGGSRTMDTWFDNWWTDRRVRDEIDGSAEQVGRTERRIADLVTGLSERQRDVLAEVTQLTTRRAELLG